MAPDWVFALFASADFWVGMAAGAASGIALAMAALYWAAFGGDRAHLPPAPAPRAPKDGERRGWRALRAQDRLSRGPQAVRLSPTQLHALRESAGRRAQAAAATAPDDALQAIDATGVITGNRDITCERGTSTPKLEYTLPIYPTPHDLAEIRTRTEGQP